MRFYQEDFASLAEAMAFLGQKFQIGDCKVQYGTFVRTTELRFEEAKHARFESYPDEKARERLEASTDPLDAEALQWAINSYHGKIEKHLDYAINWLVRDSEEGIDNGAGDREPMLLERLKAALVWERHPTFPASPAHWSVRVEFVDPNALY